MATILEKISDIENEMARTQKNKATAGHLGMLKAKLAKLRRELITPKSQGGGTGEGFDVAKVGNDSIEFNRGKACSVPLCTKVIMLYCTFYS